MKTNERTQAKKNNNKKKKQTKKNEKVILCRVDTQKRVALLFECTLYIIPDCGHFQNVPFDRHVELAEIHADIDDVGSFHLVDMTEIHLYKCVVTFVVVVVVYCRRVLSPIDPSQPDTPVKRRRRRRKLALCYYQEPIKRTNWDTQRTTRGKKGNK